MSTNTVNPSAGYFALNSSAVKVGVPGLRRGQRAAIHSLAGHLTLKSDPALAVLPTGAGKTDAWQPFVTVEEVSDKLLCVDFDTGFVI